MSMYKSQWGDKAGMEESSHDIKILSRPWDTFCE